jgi:type I restriction enzyme R subunit
LIDHLIGIGWRYLPPEDVAAMRGEDRSEPFLPEVVRQKLVELNASMKLSTGPDLASERGARPGLPSATLRTGGASVDEVLRRLRLIPANLEGNETFLNALRGRWTAYDRAQERERDLTLIDFENLEANDFSFTQELPFEDRAARRMDLVLYVNGFPVAVVENKNPTLLEPERRAFEQVQHTYTDDLPEFFKYLQFFATCDVRLHYGATWNDSLKALYHWKVEGRDYGLERLSKRFFDRAQVLRTLRDYVVFFRADDQTHKYLLRPHQMRAAERIIDRVLGGEENTGLIWHTQGSGKTLTMIVAAQMLRRMAQLENPTLLVVLDRLELEGQMLQNLGAFGFPTVVRARNKEHLRDILYADYRGLVVTLIHKFDRIPKEVNRGSSIVVLIDEAHRSQEGDLATYMRAALPNASYFFSWAGR